MKNRKIIVCFQLACCLIASAHLDLIMAQEPAMYQRKSITFVDALLFTKDIKINSSDRQYLLNTIQTGIRIARFDYNPLPENLQATFRQKLTSAGHFSESELESQINACLVTEIVKILDLNKEIRAQNLITETQRNSFITLKAKELGITAEQLEQVMNSSFLFIPVIDSYNEKTDKDKSVVSVKMTGSLLWYQVISDDQPRVEKIARVYSESNSSASKDNHSTIDGQRVDAREYAFRTAAHTLAMNFEIKTRELNMFKLTAPIVEVERRRIKFPLGRAEGIKLDEPFFVGEWIERDNGKVRFQKSGFVRISTVSDNQKSPGQLSQAVAIKKGDWARGMMIVEHPRLGIDIAFKPRLFSINVESGFMMNTKKGFVVYFDDYAGKTIGLDLDFQWNIASLVNKRQTFLVFGGTASAIPVKSAIFDYAFWDPDWHWSDLIPVESWIAGLYYGYAGYLKKYYLGPFAIQGEALLGTQIISISKVRGNDYYNGEKVTISNNSVGVRLNAGLEYAVNIDCNIGIFAGVQAFPPIDWWTVKYDEKEVDIVNEAGWVAPKMYSYSTTFGLYLHFSPPTLSFNPVAVIQNQLKNL
jgi:hypothetical protein